MTDYEKKSELFLVNATSFLNNQKKFKAFENNIAFQLQYMGRQQQVIAEKLISDVLSHGKLGNLKSCATIKPEQPTQRAMLPQTQTSFSVQT